MHKHVNIKVAGFGGQGVMMFGQMLAYSATIDQLNTLWFPSYGPETRGGTANCSIIISDEQIGSPVFQKANHLVAFNTPSFDKFHEKITDGGLILYNASLIAKQPQIEHITLIGVPATDIAHTLDNEKVANMVMLGAYLELTHLFNQHTVEAALKKFLGNKKSDMLDINLDAIEQGRQFIKDAGVMYA